MKNLIKHRQLSLKEREILAKHAIKYGVNKTAVLFGKHFATVKRWHDRYISGDSFTNIETTPLTSTDQKYLLSLSHLVGKKSLQQIKTETSILFSVDTLATFYRCQNIVIEQKYLLRLKCPNCKETLRAINVFFGRPRNIRCPNCNYYSLDRLEYLRIPFYKPGSQDYFFNMSQLTPITSNNFTETVLPLLKIPDDLKILSVYNVKPRKHNRIHIVKYFEKINNNTIPVTYCSNRFPDIQKREIFKPRSKEFEMSLICQSCQFPYLKDYQKNGDRFPDIKYRSSDTFYTALELFLLAKNNNNIKAYTLMGMSKKKFYNFKKKYPTLYIAIKNLNKNLL